MRALHRFKQYIMQRKLLWLDGVLAALLLFGFHDTVPVLLAVFAAVSGALNGIYAICNFTDDREV